MKRFLAITASLICCMGNEMPAESQTWYQRGDNYLKQGNYSAAYRTYISRCEDTSVSMDYRRIGCDAAYRLRTEAKRHGIDTSNW